MSGSSGVYRICFKGVRSRAIISQNCSWESHFLDKLDYSTDFTIYSLLFQGGTKKLLLSRGLREDLGRSENCRLSPFEEEGDIFFYIRFFSLSILLYKTNDVFILLINLLY